MKEKGGDTGLDRAVAHGDGEMVRVLVRGQGGDRGYARGWCLCWWRRVWWKQRRKVRDRY